MFTEEEKNFLINLLEDDLESSETLMGWMKSPVDYRPSKELEKQISLAESILGKIKGGAANE